VRKRPGAGKTALLADAFEAVVAAIYLDAGLAAAKEMLRTTLFESALEERGSSLFETDRKSALQEFLQGRGKPPAEYRLAAARGPITTRHFRWKSGRWRLHGVGARKHEERS